MDVIGMKTATLLIKMIKILAIILLTAIITMSGFELWKISAVYLSEAKIKEDMTAYRPGGAEPGSRAAERRAADMTMSANGGNGLFPVSEMSSGAYSVDAPIVNQGIIDMQNEVNDHIVGWLTIHETNIDYPFVLGTDNSFYLNKDLQGKEAASGSLFMDYRCSADFTGFNTIIYGHNMKNKSMFGDLSQFADSWFFENNRYGAIWLAGGTYSLEIFAYMVVSADDTNIYDPASDSTGLVSYAEKNARNFRAPGEVANVVTLSTCGYEFDGARIVVLGNLGTVQQ